MDRRRFLQATVTAGVTGTAGCLESLPGLGDSRTVLNAPEQDLSAAAHPSHGDVLPQMSFPDPLLNEKISTTSFEGERALLLTFFYTNCPDGMCPALTLRLRRAQEVADQNRYADDVAFLATTFDPERDTEGVLRAYAAEQGIDAGAENWHFMRPKRYEEGATFIEAEYGLRIEKVETGEFEDIGYGFPHYNLILLANRNGVVERAYPNGATVEIDRVIEDFETVVGR